VTIGQETSEIRRQKRSKH